MQLNLTPTFQKSLAKLSPPDQARVKQAVMDFLMNPQMSGHRLHRLNTREKRFHSISPSGDLRIIVLKNGGRYVLMYVGQHDEAYRWAERRRVETHPITGSAQLVEFEEVVREEVRVLERSVEAPPLFAHEEDDYLLALGVPQSWLETVKQLDEDGLYAILDRLPEEAAEALLALHDGRRPEPMAGKVDADPFQHPDALRRFWVAADEQALMRALDAPWERWMVFLHPSQRDAVTRNFNGPARVSGGAGTGKTVVALHRAVHLAESSGSAQVLLTTYSAPLVRHLERSLDYLAGVDGPLRRRIQVAHLHRLAYEVAARQPGFAFQPVKPRELDEFLRRAIAETGVRDVPPEFLRTEFDAVIDYWGVKEWAQYRDIQRTGRGSALSPSRRQAIWPVFKSVLEQMRLANRMTFSDLADAAREVVEQGGEPPFRHVVVDEAQDFGPRELKFIMALAPLGAHSHFFAGDVGQRIYRYPFSWLRAGVDVRGRAAHLTINYRTTRQIKRFADAALGNLEPADGEEAEDRFCVSLLSGPSPTIRGFDDGDEEAAALTEWLLALAHEGFAPNEIAIFARTKSIIDERAVPAIEAAGMQAIPISGRGALHNDPGIHVGTLHAAKGLEFRAVALVGCGDDALPHPAALAAADDADAEAVAVARERQLFYVGCTRARDVLRVSYTGRPSRFLGPQPQAKGQGTSTDPTVLENNSR